MSQWHINHVRMTESATKRRQLMARTSDYYVRVEEDTDYNPRDYDCYTESDLKKFDSGEWRAWEIVVYRACPDHVGMECGHIEIVDSLCGIDVADDTDLTGDYPSPYFIAHDYVRECAWNAWQDRKRDEIAAGNYIEDASVIVDSFRYERCAECGLDLDAHVISPDPLGNPQAWCLTAVRVITR